MLRSLGIFSLIKWFLVACVLLAIWRGFDGDIGAIVDTVIDYIQKGADIVTQLWNEVDKNNGGTGAKHKN